MKPIPILIILGLIAVPAFAQQAQPDPQFDAAKMIVLQTEFNHSLNTIIDLEAKLAVANDRMSAAYRHQADTDAYWKSYVEGEHKAQKNSK